MARPSKTPHARLWPVLTAAGEPAMLKVSSETEEQNSHRLLRWWDGDGAARLLAHEGPAILIERAGGDSLRQRSIEGDDDACTTILCQVLQRLHRPRSAPPAELVCLRTWFADLLQPRAALPPLLEQCRSLAEGCCRKNARSGRCTATCTTTTCWISARGWLAIDPKRLLGDRAFDYTTMFSNPDLCGPGIHVATRPERFAARLEQVSALAGLERTRLLRWIAASMALSAVWFRDDGDPADVDEAVARMALEALAEA
jgi:streptomycin 6-kinase